LNHFHQAAETATENGLQAGNGTNMLASMYPNPFSDLVNLEFENPSAENTLSLDVYDIKGSLVLTRNFGKLYAGHTALRVNTPEPAFGRGVYLFALRSDGKIIQMFKMIRTR